jgi:hypothetical protein
MSYLEPDTLPTKSTINSLDSFIVDSGVLETITSSNIDATTFDNGALSGLKIPVIKAYFDSAAPNRTLTIMPNEPDSITITKLDNFSKETAKIMPRAAAVGLAIEGSFTFADNGADFIKGNFTSFSSTTMEGIREALKNSFYGPIEIDQWDGSNEVYMGFRVS